MTEAIEAKDAKPEPIKFGKISFTGKQIDPQETEFDRIAIGSRGELFVLSIVTEPQKIKAIRAILNGGAKAMIQAAGVQVGRPGGQPWDRRSPGNLYAQSEGYNCATHKLGFSQVHALFVARTPGFMNVVTEASLWNELNDNRFTTPVVREWMPYIEKCLRDKAMLELCLSHRCECGVLSASTSDLDEIVESGLKKRLISVPDPDVIDVEVVETYA